MASWSCSTTRIARCGTGIRSTKDCSSWSGHCRRDGSGPTRIQAAIAAVHAGAPDAAATDWDEIVGLYDVLILATPSPVIELNRAVAVAMRDGPAAGLAVVDGILGRGELLEYRFAHAARADLCRRLGRTADARASYERALALTRQEPERRFIERRLAELPGGLPPE